MSDSRHPERFGPHTRVETAHFVLREALAAGLRVGTNGCDLILAPPRGMPSASYFSFQREILDHRDEVIDIILRGESAR
jgi:hypothetical protein